MVNKRIKVEMEEMGEVQRRQETAEPNAADHVNVPGLPEMVPVSVRSDLPEFENVTIERVLVGLDLTWVEFLALFKIELDTSKYIIKGSGGRQALLTDNVGDYVNTLKRKMKVYPVTIEGISSASSPKRSSQSNMGSPAVQASQSSTGAISSKTVRTVDKRKVLPPKFNQPHGQEGPPKKIAHMEEKSDKSEATSSKSLPPQEKARTESALLPPLPPGQKSGSMQKKVARVVAGPSKPKPKELIVNPVSPVSMNILNHIGHVKTGKLFNGKYDDDSESSDDDEDPIDSSGKPGQVADDFEIKPSVIQFLIAKISNKNMLRIREELLHLKAQDDYFQLTCVAPLAAGLLEQMLCRNHKTSQ